MNLTEMFSYAAILTIAILQVTFVCNQYTSYVTTEILPMIIADEWDDIDISVSLCGGKIKFGLYYDADYIDYSNPNLLTILA